MKPKHEMPGTIASVANPAWGIDTLLRTVQDLEGRLAVARKTTPEIRWFPYESLGSLDHLDRTLTGPRRALSSLIGEGPVLDIGCGDGEMSFLLESMGCTVRAIDCSSTNSNRMAGVKALKQALGSRVEICDADIDAGLNLDASERFSAVLLLGILYHLKNPFGVLETLSRHSTYCFLSTRVARYAPGGELAFGSYPLAYLVGADELNSDPTNYWIFSEQGLRRLCERTGWDVCDYASFGNCSDSDPVTQRGDERAYCLLKSRAAQSIDPAIRLLGGWYEDEGGWRWTQRHFLIETGEVAAGQTLELSFRMSEDMASELKTVEIECCSEGVSLGKQVFAGAGRHTYRVVLPVPVAFPRVLEFVAAKSLAKRGADDRELSLAVESVRLSA